MFASLIFASLLQVPPASPVTFDAPAVTTSRNIFECQGRHVELDILATSWTSGGPGSVQITRYHSGELSLDRDDLAQWNQQMEPIKVFLTSELLCQSGNRELISLSGNDANGRRITLHFRMENGTLTQLNR